jgi:hypothetical protein
MLVVREYDFELSPPHVFRDLIRRHARHATLIGFSSGYYAMLDCKVHLRLAELRLGLPRAC